jgi:hypothetical protein
LDHTFRIIAIREQPIKGDTSAKGSLSHKNARIHFFRLIRRLNSIYELCLREAVCMNASRTGKDRTDRPRDPLDLVVNPHANPTQCHVESARLDPHRGQL